MAHAKVLCCTSAASCSKPVRTLFASGKYGAKKSIGVAITKEEAAKDLEANWWGCIVFCNWWDKVIVRFGFGDHLQLRPTVLGSSSPFTVSHAPEQLHISLSTRAIEEGAPHHLFLVQNRMHSSIAAVPSKLVYSGKLETNDSRKGLLKHEKAFKGLEVEKKLRKMMEPFVNNSKTMSDDDLRHHLFQVPGAALVNKKTGSKVNFEQDFHVTEVYCAQLGRSMDMNATVQVETVSLQQRGLGTKYRAAMESLSLRECE